MDIDFRTLSFVITLIDLLLVVILLLQYRIGKTYKGPGWWVFGLGSTSVALLMMLLRVNIASKLICIVLANTLFILGGFLFYVGVKRFVGKKVNLRVLLIFILLMFLLMAGFTYADDNMKVRIVLVSGSVFQKCCL